MTELVNSATTIALLDGKLRVHDDTVWGGEAVAARANNLNLIRFVGGYLNHPDQIERLQNAVYDLIDPEQYAGFIVSSSSQLANHTTQDELQAFLNKLAPLPGVNCGISLHERIPHIEVNLADYIQQLLNHLIEVHGCRRIAHIHGPVTAEWGQARFAQYQAALKAHNVPFDANLLVYGDISPESGYRAMRTLLAKPECSFDAVFAANDTMAAGAVQALQEHGFAVPGDVAVVGIDNNEYAQIANPPLTTVSQSFHGQGVLAIQTLQRMLNGDAVPHRILHEQSDIIIRRSCGCFPNHVVDVQQALPPLAEAPTLSAELAAALPAIESATLTRLVDSLTADLPDTQFLNVLDEVLRQSIIDNEPVARWQSNLTILRKIVGNHGLGVDLDAMWHQARILVADATLRAQALRNSATERHHELLWEIARHLLASTSVEGLSSILVRELPRLGIAYFCIACYQSDQARVVAATNVNGVSITWQDNHVFPAQDVTPEALGRPATPYSLTVEALHFQDESLGFAVFEAEPHQAHIYEALRLYLSSALQSALLFETVQRNAAQLEAEVAARTQDLKDEILGRQQIEAALRDSQNMLEVVLDSIPVRVFWKDRNSVFIGANRASWQEAGLSSADDLIGKTDYDVVHEEMAAQYQLDDQTVMKTGKPMLNYEEMHVTKTGKRQWLNTSKVPLRDHQGETIGVLVMLQDISQLSKKSSTSYNTNAISCTRLSKMRQWRSMPKMSTAGLRSPMR